LILGAAALLALAGPAAATAATVVNGDFEGGTLKGWHVQVATEAGNWFAYTGTEPPIGKKRSNFAPLQAPPQGAFAATTDEANPDSLILYQDVALEAGLSQQLNLLVYYNSYKPLTIPAPDTLSVNPEVLGSQHNQQFRIDVMRPEAPLDSLEPTDILQTVFATKQKGPETMLPTWVTANLTPFAGQTVRLRIANAVDEEVFNAGVDAVSITRATGPGSQAAGRFSLGKPKANRKRGTVTLTARLPGPGRLTVKANGKAIVPLTVNVAAAGPVPLHLKPTASGRKTLRRKHTLRVRLAVTYTPAGGASQAASLPVVFKLAAPSHRRH
jgi:hypothetical protein